MSNKLIIKNTLTRFRTSYGFESDEVFDDIAAMLLSAAESEYLKVFWENIAAEQASRILENFYLNVLKRLLKYQHSFTLSAEKFKTSLAINNAIQVEIEHAKRCKMLLEHFANYDEYKVEPLKPSSLIHSVFDTVVSAANESITTAREGLEVSATNGNLRNLSPPADAPNNDIQADGMHIASIVMSGVNFLLVPLSYIYYAAKGDPVPFNAKNNVKWAISGVTLALGLISLLVPPAGIGIMFTMAAVGLITSIAGFSMQLYERFQTKSKLLNTKNNIRENRLLINENRAEAAIIKEDIVSNGMTDERQTKLNTLYEEFAAQQVELKSQKVIEHKLTAKVQQTYSSLQTAFSGFSIILGCAFIAGAVLSMIPFTAPIGLALLLTASVLTLTSLVISRAHLIYQKRQEVIIKESDEKEIEDVQPVMISKVKQREIKANASPLPALADVVDHDDEEGESEHPRERGHMPF